MSNSNDQSIDNLINAMDDITNACFSPATEEFLAQYTSTLSNDSDYASVVNASFPLSSAPMGSPTGFSPANNSTHQELSNVLSRAVALPNNMQMNSQGLEIIAQPYYGTKLRYRSDYENNENRLGVLKNRTKDSSYQGPAIRIPTCYLNPNDEYSIRVSLVTIKHKRTGLHYFHPYEIEHPTNENSNDRPNNSVWFPIQNEDCTTGIKSFPTLRIVKKRAPEVKAGGDLRVFDCQQTNLPGSPLRQFSSAKDIINEYNLEHSQIAFTVGKRMIDHNNQIVPIICPETTVFSEEMIEGAGNETEGDNDTQSPSEKVVPSPSFCRVYKYAPKYGYDQSQEDMVIFLTTKLEPKKYGELKVTFQCDIPGGQWSQPITDLDVKDRMVSFKTPTFPYPVNETAAVDVIIQQDSRHIDKIKYFYFAIFSSCSKCQLHAVRNEINEIPNVPNKRRTGVLEKIDFSGRDHLVPKLEDAPKSEPSLPEPLPKSSSTTNKPNSTSVTSNQSSPTTAGTNDPVMEKLAESIDSLFLHNDYGPLFRICRSFLNKNSDLIHTAIDENHSELLLKFIPNAQMKVLQQKNELGETALLHALRLNRLEIVRAILKKEKSEELLENIDGKDNNIFHMIARSSIPLEAIDAFINYLLENSIRISEKFDRFNHDHRTPLQLSICENNHSATKLFLKHFQSNIYESKTGDNLIHLAVRHGDLPLIQYLIETGRLSHQVNQSSMQMTPKELAQSLQHHDMVNYFNEISPPQEIDENDTSDDDD